MTEHVSPGHGLRPDQVGQIAAEYQLNWGLSIEQFVVSEFGFPVAPIPNIVAPDAPDWWVTDSSPACRVPSAAAPNIWGHPVFWLPDDVVIPSSHEPKQAWVARMFFELLGRDFVDVVEPDQAVIGPLAAPILMTSWFDFLAESGFDLDDGDIVKTRLSNWHDGSVDPMLDALRIGVVPDESAGSAQHQANTYLAEAQSDLDDYVAKYVSQVASNAEAGIAALPKAMNDLFATRNGVESAAASFYRAQKTQPDRKTNWPELVAALETFQQSHDALAEHWGELAVGIATHGLADPHEWWSAIADLIEFQDVDAASVGSGRGLIEAIRDEPSNAAGYDELMLWVDGLKENWGHRCVVSPEQFLSLPALTEVR